MREAVSVTERGRRICWTLAIVPLLLIAIFVMTAPWHVAAYRIDRLTSVLAAAFTIWLAAMLWRPWRTMAVRWLALARPELRARVMVSLFLASAVAFLRLSLSRYRALQVNAWDFSIFDLALGSGNLPLYDPVQRAPLLGIHGYYLLHGLLPLYELWRSPFWLLLLQPLALAAAVAIAAAVGEAVTGDSLAAIVLAGALALNTFTAKIAGYVFHPEAFYPLALLIAFWALLRGRPLLFAAALILTAMIKEDAVLPLTGVAVAALLVRRPRWAAPAVAVGALAFTLGVFIVMPRFSGSAPQHPWYSSHWNAYGPTPLDAAAGILLHPIRVLGDLSRSGVPDLLETFAFVPLGGGPWFLPCLPALVTYGVAQGGRGGVSHFSLYYSAPVLPLLFIATAFGARRLAALRLPGHRPHGAIRRRRRLRSITVLIFLVAALDGASFRFPDPRPERRDVRESVAQSSRDGPVRVQGALLPHAGYRLDVSVLDRSRPVSPREGVILDLAADAFPFTVDEMGRLVAELGSDPRRSFQRTRHGLMIFGPASRMASR